MSVKVSRRYTASAERVFDAWLDVEKAKRFFFATETGTMVKAEIDPRVGGTFVFVDRRDGEDIEHVGEWIEIERPRKLVFDFKVPKYSQEKTRVTIEITALADKGCELTLSHEGVLPEYQARTVNGWTTILSSLDRFRKDAAIEFLQWAGTGKAREAFAKHVGKGFKHHNPYFAGDAESLMNAMLDASKAQPHKVIDVKRALEDRNQVAVHSHVIHEPGACGAAVVHVFRFTDDDKIVELWDVGGPVPEAIDTKNEHGMF